MNKEKFAKELGGLAPLASICFGEPMSKHTSFKIGGPADIMVIPKSKQEVAHIFALAKELQLPLTVLGNGSNVLVKDKGIRGVVLKIGGGLTGIEVKQGIVHCGAGLLLSVAANAALNDGLTGMEFAAGIPGSVGGGVYMNAGAYAGELKDIVFEVESIDEAGAFHNYSLDQLELSYRHSIFSTNEEVILAASFKLHSGDKQEIRAKMDDFAQRRKSKQPLEFSSAGSTFKRPQGHFAGKLIQDAGLCGLNVGCAQVSEKHAGFIINRGNATASDVLALINIVQDRVEKAFGVHLHPEVRIIGE